MMQTLSLGDTRIRLDIFGMPIEVCCHHDRAARLVHANYSAFVTAAAGTVAELSYVASCDETGLHLQRAEAESTEGWSNLDAGEFIFLLEKDLTIEAQKRRPHLYFMHAAALAYQGDAFLLIGNSGNGKSTTCWGLLHHGCDYLSDELAPIDLRDNCVQPYPHALCLKSEPAPPYSLPPDTLRTEATLHVTTEQLPCSVIQTPRPLRAIFHVQHLGVEHKPTLSELSAAEAGMLIYANALNPLCHGGNGLDAALAIAGQCRRYRLTTGGLEVSAMTILNALNR